MAGYSGTPLPKKLGIKPGSRLLYVSAPSDFAIPDLPEGVAEQRRATADPYDTILLFCMSQADVRKRFQPAAARLTVPGALWICWPKKASGIQTDLGENDVRAIGLDFGLVDDKV
jgi:hypothetical protein